MFRIDSPLTTFHFKRFTKEEEQLMRQFFTTIFVVALIFAPASPAKACELDDPDVPGIVLRVFGLDAQCKIAVIRDGWEIVYDYVEIPGGVEQFYYVSDTGGDYSVRLSKSGFYSIDANTVRTVYEGYDELWASFDCFYQIKVPVGVTNVWISSWDWCVSNANAGDMIDLIADWNNIRTARLEYDLGGTHYITTFKLDGSDPFAGNVSVNFPGVEGVTIQYCNGGAWFNLPGTFSHQTGFITLPQGSTSIRAVKGAMFYQFDGLNIGSGLKVFDVPVIPLNVIGIDANCKIGVLLNGWDTVYANAEISGGFPRVYNVFDTGEDYTVRLSKNGFYSIDVNAFRTQNGSSGELWAFFDCFYKIKVPVGVTNVSIASWDWCVRNANEGDMIDLIADWNNIRTARLDYEYGGKNYNLLFKLDGSDPFAGYVSVNFPGVEGVTLQYCKGGTWFNFPGTFNHQTGFITLPEGSTSIRAVKGAMSYRFDGLNIGIGSNVFDVPVIGLRVSGLDTACKIGVFLNVGDTVYANADVPGSGQKLYYVFATGENYTVRLSKTGFYSIDVNAVRTGDELRASFDCFYRIKVPAGVTNVSISSWDWCVRNANAGDTIDLVADWNNIRTARLDYEYGGKNYSVLFKLDGSDPFAGIVVKAAASAFVTQLNGNKNDLTITVEETYANGSTVKTPKTFSINNNTAGTFAVGNYKVYVDAKNNGQIRECYIVK